MRKMRNTKTGDVLNVTRFIIVGRLMWEYYITDDQHSEDIVRALVLGHEDEIGDISISEIKPYAIVDTKNLKEIMPAVGYEWVD